MSKTIPPINASAARWRQLQNIQPGHWVLMEYEDNEGKRSSVWSQVHVRLSLVDRTTYRKIEELRGVDAQGFAWDFRQLSGFELYSLTARQGEKVGLSIPSGGEAA